jgi:aryl-alcohol dehydrogenase-like predicted oxidoreductase
MLSQSPFGRTGHLSTRVIFGAAAFFNVTQAEADRTLDLLPEYGINHIDTAASYGEAEVRLGPWLKHHRRQYFLATKTEHRTCPAAREELYRSLERLQVDSLDLWQIHNLSDPQEWEVALGPGGALEAFVEARQQKLIRFIGITGHGVNIAAMHRRALERFDFDSVLLPCNYVQLQNPSYAADFSALLAVCRERRVAVQTIKAIARDHWGDQPHTHSTWYTPLVEQADIDRAVHWVLGRPDIFLNTAADINLLPKVLDAARRYLAAPPEADMQGMAQSLEMKPLFE